MARNKKRNASVAVAVSVSIFGFGQSAHAAPSGGEVVAGNATISQQALETLINQTSSKAVINWQDFSIDPGELVKFIQESQSAVTLNRVTGGTVSQIKGALTANGNIFLINPNGIVFGATAQVDVAGLIATTFDIADQDFMDGKFNFSGEMMSNASIRNEGELKVGDGGFVYLIAPNVENTGHIIANVGTVALGADGNYAIDLQGSGLIKFAVSEATLTSATSGVTNSGTIEAGHVLLSGSQTSDVISSVVNTGEITAATSLTLQGSSVDNHAGTLALDVKSGDSHDQITLQSDAPASSGTVDFQGNSLSTSGNVNGTIKVTNSTGGVTLNNADVDGNLIVTAAGGIDGAGNVDGDARADHLSLNTTVDGAGIGGENNPLRIDADTLSASASSGHIVISDTAGDVALVRVSTGDTSAEAGRRAIIKAEAGDLTGVAGGEPNVQAWATNLQADGDIGSAGQAVTTAVDVLSASTQDGGIHINDVDGELVVNSVSAGERITLGGQTVSSGAISNGDGEVTLSNGATGSHDVSIGAEGNMVLAGAVNATGDLSLESRDGALYTAGDNVLLTGRELTLNAAGAVGQQGVGALKTQSNRINAHSGENGVYLSEGLGLTVGSIIAEGDNNNVEVSATQGDITLGNVTATGGDVTASAGQGAIKGDGSLLNVEADSLTLNAKGAIASAADRLRTDVHTLTTVTGTNLVGTYVANLGPLERLDVTTLDGNVSVSDSDGTLAFTGSDDALTVQRSGQGMDLDFTNNAGGLVLTGLALQGHDVSLTASGGISDTAGVLSADSARLDAGKGIDLTTNVDDLDAAAANGDIDIDNSAHTGTLTVNADADRVNGDGDVRITQGGDLRVGQVQATGTVSLSAEGSVNGNGDGYAVIAKNLDVRGTGIGSESTPFATNVDGNLFANAGASSLFLSNLGSLTLLGAEADGDITVTQNGDAILDTLKAGGDVVFSASGRVSDGNGDGLNISAQSLTMNAQQIGQRDGVTDALELNVDELMLDVSNGGIFVRNLNGAPLNLVRANAAGGDIDIATAGDLDLGTVKAAGNTVTLTSGGAIEDARPNGSSTANVQAKRVNISGEDGVGENGALSLDVNYLSVTGGDGDVNAVNMGAVAVDSDSLVGKGASGVTIVATTITILDNNGGLITLDGGKLVLTATNGNIVFLNQDDTIMLPGGGSITLTARADADHEGYNGNIITGNLITQGGDITLDADTNITLGMLDTGGTGDVSVTARHGVILDGNGSDANIRGDHVTLVANTPSLRDAEIVRDTAIADYAGRVAELNAKILQLEVLEQQLQAYITMLKTAIVQQGITQHNQNVTQSQVDSLSAQVASAETTLNALATALSVATVVRNAVAIGAGAAQAIPFSGDAGADAAFAVVDLALSAADTALDSYERYSFSPLVDELNELFNDLDVAKAFNQDAISNVQTYTNLRNTLQVSRDMADQSVFNAQVARDASEALREQAIGAYDQNQDIDFSVDKPLGVEANRLDIGTTSGRAINSAVYLESNGSLGLGDIESIGEIRVQNVAGDISVVGEVISPSLITLQADGAVRGIGGTWVNGVWTPSAGQLNAPLIAVRAGENIGSDEDVLHTNTSEIAANGGDGDVYIVNDNGGDELVVGTVDGVSGVQSDGDIGIKNSGDLRLKTQIRDTDLDSENNTYLVAAGRIVDDNGETLNVTAHDLYFQAGGDVELDTAVDRLVDGEVTGEGDITVRDQGDLNIVDLATADGAISVSATGAMLLETLAAGGDHGDITLSAGGDIDDDQDNDTHLSGKALTLTATGGSIGATGDNQHRALDTRVDSVTASADGEVNLDDSDDLDVTRVATSTGDVTLTSQSGDLHLGEVRTDGDGNTITLQAAGAIDALNDADSTAELHASNLALRAGNGIGAADQSLLVEASALEADAGSGGLYLTDRNNDLTIGGVTPNLGLPALSGLDANGDIRVDVTDGSLTVNEDITQTGDGDTRLTSSGSQTYYASLDAAGDATLSAGTDLTVHGHQLHADGDLNASAVTGNLLATDWTALSSGQDMTLSAGQDATIQSATLAADRDLSVTADQGTTAITVEASASAGRDLTLASNGADVFVNNFASATANGDVTLHAKNKVGIDHGGSVTAQTGDLDITADDGDVVIAGASASAGGDLSADAGLALQVDNSTASAGNDVTLTAGTDVSVTNGATVDAGGDQSVTGSAGDITVTNSALTADGDLDLLAGGLIQLSSANLSSGVAPLVTFAPAPTPRIGDLTLTANTGDIVLTNGTRLQSTGDATLDAQAAAIEVNNGSSVTAATDVTLSAHTDIALSGGANLTASAGDLAMTGTEGDISLNSATVIAGGELTGTAGQGIILTDGSHARAGSDLSLAAQGADLTLDNGSDATAARDLAMAAKGSVTLDHGAFAEATSGDLSLTATDGDITLTNSAHASAAGELTGTAGQGITATNGAYLQAGTDLSLDAQGADLTLDNGSRASAAANLTMAAKGSVMLDHSAFAEATAGDLSITATDGDAALSHGAHVTAGGTLTAHAGDNITLTDAFATSGAHDMDDPAPAQQDAGMTLTADQGDLTLTRSQAQSGGDLTGSAGQNIGLTDANATAAGTATLTAGTDEDLGGEADIALANSHVAANGGDATLSAADGISLQGASTVVARDNLSADAQAGDLTLIQNSTLAAQTGQMDLDAGNAVAFTDSSATAATSMTLDATDAGITLNNSHATAGTDLSLDAGTDITLTHSDDPDTTGSTLTAQTGDLSLNAGDNIALDSASSGTAHGDVTANAEQGDLTVIEQSKLLAQTGKMDLDAGNRVAVTDSTLHAATDLTVDAAAADIALQSSHATAGDNLAMTAGTDVTLTEGSSADATAGDLAMTASAGDVRLTDSSTSAAGTLDLSASETVAITRGSASSGGDLTLTGSEGDITVTSGLLYTGGILDAHAGDNLTLTDALAISGAHAPGDPAPAWQDAGMTLTADQGDITLTRSQAQSGGDLTASAGQNIGLTDSNATAAGSATLTAGTDEENGSEADIALDNSHVTANGGDATLTAADGIGLQGASTVVARDNLSADAQAGDLTLIQNSTLAAQTGQMDLDAGNAVAFTDSSATAATSMTLDASDAGIALSNSHATAGTDLSLDAGTDITLTDSEAPLSTGSTLVAESGNLSLDAGNNIHLDSASSGVAHGDVTADAETGDLTVIEQSKLLAQTGKMDLDAGNRVAVTDSTLNAATDLTVDATAADIALDNSHATAGDNLSMTAGTDVTLVNGSHADANSGDLAFTGSAGDVALTDSVATAHGTLNLSAGENVGLTRSSATSGDHMTLTGSAGDVTLAQSQVTSSAGDLTAKAGQNLAMTDANATASGKVTLAAGTDEESGADADLTLDNSHVNANGGDAILSAAGSIGLQRASTVVARDNLSADAQAGDLTLIGASLLNAQTGYMDLHAGQGVAITDSTLVAATDLSVDADGADIALDNSHATAQSGDATLTAADSISLEQASMLTAHGDLSADAQAGDLTLDGNSTLTAQTGAMDLDAGNAVVFTDASATAAQAMTLDASAAGITLNNSHATAGTDLALDAGTNITLTNSEAPGATGSSLSAQTGDLSLAAGGNIALSSASSGAAAGDLTANAEAGDLTVIEQSSLTAQTGQMDLDAGNRVAVADSVLSAATALTVDAAAADIDLDNASATAGTDLSMTAATDVTLDGSTVEATAGDLSLTGTDGDVAVTGSSVEAGNDLSADAGNDIAVTDSTATAAANIDLHAGNGVAMSGSDADAGAAITVTADAADIDLDNASATAGTDLSMTAATDVTLDGSNAEATTGDLSLTGTDGDVMLTDSLAIAANDLSVDAGANVGLTDSTALAQRHQNVTAGDNVVLEGSALVANGGDLTVTADTGDIDLADLSQAFANGELTATAGNNVTLTDSQAGASNGKLVVTATEGDLALTDSGLTAGDALTASAAGDIIGSKGNAFAGTDLDLHAGNGVALTDIDLHAGQAMTVTADAADIMLDDSRVIASTDLTLDAAGNIKLTDTGDDDGVGSDITAINGDLSLTAGDSIVLDSASHGFGHGNVTANAESGDLTVIEQSTLRADTGNLDLDAGQSVVVDNGLLLAHTDLDITAGDDVTLTDTTAKAATGALAIDADGDVRLGNTRTQSEGDQSVRAGGEIAMSDGSEMVTESDLILQAGGDIAITRLQAQGDVSVTSDTGGISADPAEAEHIQGQNLFISAAKSVGSALSGLKTRVGTLYANLTGSGDLYMDEADALTVKGVQLADGDAHLTTGGDLDIEALQVNGDTVLNSAGHISTGDTGLVRADDLNATAVDGIDLNAELDSATLAVTGDGRLDLLNQGDLRLDGASTANGDIDVAVRGDLGVGEVSAAGEHDVQLATSGAMNAAGAGSIDARNVELYATDGLGADAALNLSADRLTAITTGGDVMLNQSGSVALENVRTGAGDIGIAVTGGDATLGNVQASGDVSLTATDGALFNDTDDTNKVRGIKVTLASANGIGSDDNALDTRASQLDASVTGSGGLYVDEQDGLSALNARTANGDIRVSTSTGNLTIDQVQALSPGNAVMLFANAGAILDGNGDADNIIASLLALSAGQGIGRASDPLDVTVSTLAADGGNGGVYINNGGSDPLHLGTVAGVSGIHGEGDVYLNTAGDLDVNDDVTGNGDVSLLAGGDLNQNGDLHANSNILVSGGGDVTMGAGTETRSNRGEVSYQAGQTLVINTIDTRSGLAGGTINLQSREMHSIASGPGSLQADQVNVRVPGFGRGEFETLMEGSSARSRFSLNDRAAGGEVTRDVRFMQDAISPPGLSFGESPRLGMLPAALYQPVTSTGYGFQHDSDSEEWHFNP
ncbi:two-partner secretion domain-containing protein [Alloalcanivorax mobilis]|uniref:two-partner secretion domain-containing protein n=1 Tax=Alloalcanivorax mobilis TaxID=2019569 RepID=UPI001300017A|nr:filamentous hemagglutinin N-terminal domain-containing protein [Alloalcanivorax mobilis]